MPDIFRFVDENGVERLDMNDETGWMLHRGLDLGTPPVEKTYLSQAPFDGSVLATSRRGVVTMKVLLTLMPQLNAGGSLYPDDGGIDRMVTLMNALAVELDRPTNIIEFRPDGFTAVGLQSYLIDTYRSSMPSLYRGLNIPSVFTILKSSGLPLELQIDREPVLRGHGPVI